MVVAPLITAVHTQVQMNVRVFRVEGTARRRRGGQGMIAFASEEQGGPGDVVIKAYFCSRTFERERRLLENPQLKHAAAACIEVVDRRDACAAEESEDDSDEDRTLPMVTNTVVPMLVVSERGECLREYMQKKVPAAWGSRLQVLCFQNNYLIDVQSYKLFGDYLQLSMHFQGTFIQNHCLIEKLSNPNN